MALSPLVLYLAVTRLAVLPAALCICAWIGLRSVAILLDVPRKLLLAALELPAIAVAFTLLGGILRNQVLLLLMPSMTQAAMAWSFMRSLGGSRTPLVESFARIQRPVMTPVELQYCRIVTQVWAWALVAMSAGGVLAAIACPPRLWALFTGVGIYFLIAALFAAEYVVRTVRFRGLGITPYQRMLARIWPPSQEHP